MSAPHISSMVSGMMVPLCSSQAVHPSLELFSGAFLSDHIADNPDEPTFDLSRDGSLANVPPPP